MIAYIYNVTYFTLYYNTRLTVEEEEDLFSYDKSMGTYGICYDDMYDYDIKGAWKALVEQKMNIGKNNHLGDTYKKPNHPTFSDESIYHRRDGFYGGHWFEMGDDAYIFVPGLTNFYSTSSLSQYFETEKNCQLRDFRYEFFRKKCLKASSFSKTIYHDYSVFCNELLSKSLT